MAKFNDFHLVIALDDYIVSRSADIRMAKTRDELRLIEAETNAVLDALEMFAETFKSSKTYKKIILYILEQRTDIRNEADDRREVLFEQEKEERERKKEREDEVYRLAGEVARMNTENRGIPNESEKNWAVRARQAEREGTGE